MNKKIKIYIIIIIILVISIIAITLLKLNSNSEDNNINSGNNVIDDNKEVINNGLVNNYWIKDYDEYYSDDNSIPNEEDFYKDYYINISADYFETCTKKENYNDCLKHKYNIEENNLIVYISDKDIKIYKYEINKNGEELVLTYESDEYTRINYYYKTKG